MKQFLHKQFWPDWLVIFFLTFLLPFFFYNLGLSSLVSWDEAWYAEIARNIIKSGSLFNLSWNEMAYYDHPPVGFWLIALGELIFGYSEFGVRFSSALIGFLSVITLYFLGKVMFNRVVGVASALGLASSFWFLYRARSGNLDVFLTFFFVLTFFMAWKARQNSKWLVGFGVSFALLILTKTGIPFTILPALIIVFWGKRFKLKDLISTFGLLVFLGGVWLVSQILTNSSFFDRYFMIGLPGVGVQTSYVDNFILAKTYLHDGIGKWFWPGVVGIIMSFGIGVYLFLVKKVDRKWFIFPLFCLTFFGPFVLSAKGHIWHLIPLHPFMILSFFAASFVIGESILKIATPFLFRNKQYLKYSYLVLSLGTICFSIYLSFFQLKSAWIQFIDQTKYISDEQILSTEAGKIDGKFFIDDDFGPTAVWYSGGKRVGQIRDDDISRLFNKQGQFGNIDKFTLITKQYRLDDQGIAKERYQILKLDRDKILVINN
jgi:4-amino-4-deoxy-L-arabinose transferase-like glycosyltransferase